MSDEDLRREVVRVLEDMPPSASTAGHKILARGVLALLADRDRLAAEVARLRAELERAAYAFHSAHLGWEGPCCCPAHKIASEALEPK